MYIRSIFIAILLVQAQLALAQLFERPVLTGMYFQWGYNRDIYSRSDLHFENGSKYNFTVYNAVAKDQPNFNAFKDRPLDITIPQNVYRIGFYLNKKRTHAIEINYDHAKYVVKDNQTLRIKGTIYGDAIDTDVKVEPWFIHFEHTNGANFYFVNYVGIHDLLRNKRNSRLMASAIWKLGAGIVVPKSDITLFGKELDNKYHVAGYIAAAEAGLRYYPLKKWFLEATGKGGFANYLSVLTVNDDGRAHHHFFFGEIIGTVGYEIRFKGRNKNVVPQ